MRADSALLQLREFLRKVEIQPAHFIISALLALGAAVFEGIGIALLVPLAKGVIEMDFGFVENLPVLKTAFVHLPPSLFSTNPSRLTVLLALIFLAAILRNLLEYAASLSLASYVRRFAHSLRDRIFSRYLSFGKLFFDRNSVGHLNYVLVGSTGKIAGQLLSLNRTLVSLFMLASYLVVMFAISWRLTLFVLCVFPLLNYALKWPLEKIEATSKSCSESQAALSRRIFNMLSSIELLKAYTGEAEEQKQFSSMSGRVEELEFAIDKSQSLMSAAQQIMVLTMILVLISAMAFLVMGHRSGTVPGFLVYFYTLRRSSSSFGSFNKIKASLAALSGPLADVLNVLDDTDKHFVIDGHKELRRLESAIEFDHLSFSYVDGVQVLKHVTFRIERGRMTAIVGPTGAGKTTLVRLLLRFYDCPPSSIKIDGIDIADFTLKSLRGRIALVSQDIMLFNDTLRRNITYGMDGQVSEEQLVDAVERARLYDFVAKLPEQFDTLVGDKGIRLSGGERQRVSIARAMLKGADILILDEATSALDTKTERLIQEAIEELVREKTSIIIAHRLSTIRNADKIVVIEDGQLIEEGALSELLQKKGRFYEYWEAQKFY